jgi:spore coat polysaccharide biosynthesis predicted glycosyltransferase SpsG
MIARVGQSVGLGHWTRSLTLASELKKRGHQVFIRPISDSDQASFSIPRPWGEDFQGTPDIQVIDDPLEAPALCEPSSKRIALDYYGKPDGYFDLIISPIDRTPSEIRQKSRARYLSGLSYLILEPDTDVVYPSPAQKNLLIVIGGRDTKRSTLPVLSLMKEKGLFDLFANAKIVLPPDHADFEGASKTVSKITNTELIPTQPTLLPLMHWCSHVICNGGMTAAATLLQQRSAVFLPQTRQEEEFLRHLEIPSDVVIESTNFSSDKLQRALHSALESPTFKRTGKSGLDGKGCKRVADLVESIKAS